MVLLHTFFFFRNSVKFCFISIHEWALFTQSLFLCRFLCINSVDKWNWHDILNQFTIRNHQSNSNGTCNFTIFYENRFFVIFTIPWKSSFFIESGENTNILLEILRKSSTFPTSIFFANNVTFVESEVYDLRTVFSISTFFISHIFIFILMLIMYCSFCITKGFT